MSELSDLALKIAIGELGKQEVPKGSNWGPDVKKYLASVGISFPASWCMALMYWCFNEAATELGLVNPLIRTGGVLHQFQAIDSKYKIPKPQIGSIFILDFGGGLGHAGIIENINGNSLNKTVEGNATTESGSREGFEICRKDTRLISRCKGFITV